MFGTEVVGINTSQKIIKIKKWHVQIIWNIWFVSTHGLYFTYFILIYVKYIMAIIKPQQVKNFNILNANLNPITAKSKISKESKNKSEPNLKIFIVLFGTMYLS